MNILIDNVRVLARDGMIAVGTVALADGRIESVRPGPSSERPTDGWFDGGGRLLTPGLIDLHTHGIGRSAYQTGPTALADGAAFLPRFGVTCVFPTVVPDPSQPGWLECLATLAAALPNVAGARMPGLHLEGPFVAVAGAACPTLPGDLTLLNEMLSAADGQVSIVSLAPEVDRAVEVIERLVERNIVPFLTHTQADVATTQRAIDAGARHATHFYDVFHAPKATDGGVRPVGAVEAILADPRCSVDFIGDGIHVDPTAIRMACRAKDPDKVMLITDSNIGAGLPAGTYPTPWGYSVAVAPGAGARIADRGHPKHGRLSGSTLTMDVGINNLLNWLDAPAEQIWAMGTSNPAALTGLRKGAIAPDYDADLVLWEQSHGRWTPVRTWVAGTCVWARDCDIE